MQIAYWIVAGILALASLAAGGLKVVRPPAKLAESGLTWAPDFPAWTVTAIGLLEVLGAVGLILPPLTGVATILAPLAALGLVLVQVGAIITHIVRGEVKTLVVNIVLLLLAVAAAWLGFATWA
ncbi:DoxX family protein [Microbacterium sp.]|uniref:DoxX family protein n=1 Tax=Microbacterium sp. TaxID=51671 RepID=UPI002FE14270